MLARKITIIVISVVILAILAGSTVVLIFMAPKFRRLEQQQAHTNMKRVVEAIDREMYHLQTLCIDWAALDDTYNYITVGDEHFIDSNMQNSTFAYNGFNLIYLVRNDGSFAWGKAYDFENDKEISIDEFSPRGLPATSPWLAKHNKDYHTAIIQTSAGLMLLAYCPVVHSDSSGPVVGTFFMGVLFSQNLLQTMRTQTEVPFEMKLVTTAEEDNETTTSVKGSSVISVKKTIPLLNTDQALCITFDYPRNIYGQGLQIMRLSWASIIIIGSILLIALLIFINRIVVRPIKSLEEHALAVSRQDAPLPPLFPDRRDEFGFLAHAYDDMIARLFSTRSRLLEMSFQSGLSEMARTFLHNIRNALSPVSLITDEMKLSIGSMKNTHLDESIRLLTDPDTDEERREELKQYIHLYEQQLQQTCEELHGYLQSIDQVQHSIEALLSYQEQWAHAQPVMEPVQPEDFLRDIAHALPPHITPQISIISGAEQMPVIRLQRSTLLLVFSRLIANGCALLNNPEARVILSEELDEINAEWAITVRWLELTLSQDEVEALFQRDTNFRDRGDWHWVANTLHQMNILFQLDGPTGSFTLHIPIALSQ